jgi:hypothetical protein
MTWIVEMNGRVLFRVQTQEEAQELVQALALSHDSPQPAHICYYPE